MFISSFYRFVNRLHDPGPFMRQVTPIVVTLFLIALITVGIRQGREIIPHEMLIFFLSVMLAYFAARALAFRLYVPNRYLLLPMGVFFITAFSIGSWRLSLVLWLLPRETNDMPASDQHHTKVQRLRSMPMPWIFHTLSIAAIKKRIHYNPWRMLLTENVPHNCCPIHRSDFHRASN